MQPPSLLCPTRSRDRLIESEITQIAANSIDISVLGVQGASQVVAWSTAMIGGIHIDKSLTRDDIFDRKELADECKYRSQRIIRAKGSIPLGIGSIVCSICSSILFDKRRVRPVSHFQADFGCCFSLPVVLGRKGVIRTLQVPLDSNEMADLNKSADELRAAIEKVKENQ